MNDSSRYAVGLDIGTSKVRCVVGQVDASNGAITVIGVGESDNSGMRKGTVVKLSGPAMAIDKALQKAEQMSGYEVNQASISINGSHIQSQKTDGMIAIGSGGEVTQDDVYRLEDVATTGKISPNRTILDIVPYSYKLDGQEGIKDPVGMEGVRLEVDSNVVSALTPHFNTLEKAAEEASVEPDSILPSVVASGKAVLTDKQLENGVAVIDMGAATTGIAIYEEGDLQHVGVVPIGGNHITNDLAIGLKTNPEIAEMVKIQHGVAEVRENSKKVTVKKDKESYEFDTEDIDEIIDARLEQIFEEITKELKKAGRGGKLANGVVLVGGASELKKIVTYAKNTLEMAAVKGKPSGFGGVADELSSPSFAAVVGLMLNDIYGEKTNQSKNHKNSHSEGKGFLSSLLSRFKN